MSFGDNAGATNSHSQSFDKAAFELSRSRWCGTEAAAATGGQENDHARP
jgi:hypothetical protein